MLGLCLGMTSVNRRPSAAVDVTFVGHAENGSALSTYTFANAIPGAGRYVIGIGTRQTTGTPSISSVTGAGTAATAVNSVASGSGNISLTAMYIVDAPAAGNVVVTLAMSALRCGIGVWKIVGSNAATPIAGTQTSTANPAAATLTVPDRGAIVGYVFGGNSTAPTATWAGATEDFDLVVSSVLIHSGAHANVASGAAIAVSATLSANSLGNGAVFAAVQP